MRLEKNTGKFLYVLILSCLILPQKAATGTFKLTGRGPATDADETAATSLVYFSKPEAPALPVVQAPIFTAATPEPVKGNDAFPVEAGLQSRVQFWIRIYTELSTSEGVLHDSKYVDLIYSKLDFKDVSDFTLSARDREKTVTKRIKTGKEDLKRVLLSLHHKQNHSSQALTTEELRVAQLMKDINEPNKYLAAAHRKRLRFQLGQKDRFLQGLYYSGRYLPLMERIFKAKGLPVELTRLPFVESSFNLRAHSKVGASGIWQFMRSTGKLFMKIDDTIDERNDPIRATEAATQLLAGNFEALGSWPLALTAYNHGRLGMVRAVQKTKSTSLVDIINSYKGSTFGFASSNFYAEFVAAVEVSKNADKYFSKPEIDRKVEFAEFIMTDYVDFRDVATYSRIPFDVLQELNPGLSDLVITSKKLIPAGYVMRIPPEERDRFLARYNEIPGYRKFSSQKIGQQRYLAGGATVKKGRR